MQVTNYFDSFESLGVDEKTGIRIIPLTNDKEFSLYLAEIRQATILPAHYHQYGIEVYQILNGEGDIEIGTVLNDNVMWTSKTKIKSGDCFSIQPREVHRLVNSGNSSLQIIFCTPPSHLGEDRIFISEFEGEQNK